MIRNRAAGVTLAVFLGLLAIAPGLAPGRLFSGLASIQQGGRLEGTVVDQAGARVADARVMLQNVTGEVAAETRTDSEGHFAFADVGQGRYEVIVKAAGFSQVDRPAIDVRAGAVKTLTIKLEVHAVAERVDVSATSSARFPSRAIPLQTSFRYSSAASQRE